MVVWDGKQRDSVALSALQTAVTTYFTTTYPTDTLLRAFVTPDTTYVLISKDTVLYATNITATGTLISRMKVAPHGSGRFAQASLPASITTYLTTTYPGYVFQNAFSESDKGSIIGYSVFISANSTNYIIIFNSAGTFVSAKVVHKAWLFIIMINPQVPVIQGRGFILFNKKTFCLKIFF
ncbi:hypothetical protein MgSA37_02471 [Mucilaginibacter gotjawali]|nr:hypothetical protein MgSA37_02471 [Mucilaginibacter gotjawali]